MFRFLLECVSLIERLVLEPVIIYWFLFYDCFTSVYRVSSKWFLFNLIYCISCSCLKVSSTSNFSYLVLFKMSLVSSLFLAKITFKKDVILFTSKLNSCLVYILLCTSAGLPKLRAGDGSARTLTSGDGNWPVATETNAGVTSKWQYFWTLAQNFGRHFNWTIYSLKLFWTGNKLVLRWRYSFFLNL